VQLLQSTPDFGLSLCPLTRGHYRKNYVHFMNW